MNTFIPIMGNQVPQGPIVPNKLSLPESILVESTIAAFFDGAEHFISNLTGFDGRTVIKASLVGVGILALGGAVYLIGSGIANYLQEPDDTALTAHAFDQTHETKKMRIDFADGSITELSNTDGNYTYLKDKTIIKITIL